MILKIFIYIIYKLNVYHPHKKTHITQISLEAYRKCPLKINVPGSVNECTHTEVDIRSTSKKTIWKKPISTFLLASIYALPQLTTLKMRGYVQYQTQLHSCLQHKITQQVKHCSCQETLYFFFLLKLLDSTSWFKVLELTGIKIVNSFHQNPNGAKGLW